MNTKHLVYFLEIVKQKNMNKAAEILFVSQSSLSQYLSRLEQEMGNQLFYRQKGNLTLTKAGEIYRDYALQILKLEEEMTSKISAITKSTLIRVGVNSIWGNLLVTSIISQFHLKYPDITIETFDENHKLLKKYINEGSIDIAVIATDSLEHLTGYTRVLRMEEIVFAVSNSNAVILENPGLPSTLSMPQLIRYFGREAYILNKENSSFRPMVNSAFSACAFQPNVICEVNNMATVRNMVNHDLGVSFIPESIVDRSLPITYFSLEPRIARYNGLICRSTLGFTEEEQYFISLVQNYPLFKAKEPIAPS